MRISFNVALVALASSVAQVRGGPVRNLALELPEAWGGKYNNNEGSESLLEDVVGSAEGAIIQSYVVLKKGRKVAEYYADGQDATTQTDVFSVQKGFTSMYIGMFIDQGVFHVDETLGDIWPATDPVWDTVTNATLKQAITISQLLDSTSGFDDSSFSGGETLVEVLEFPIKVSEPGVFNYLGFANILNYVILERTGSLPQDWAADNFFPFLGMTSGADYIWGTNGDGVALSRNGLSLTTLDMAKFGQLLLQKGKSSFFNQLIPASWIETAKSTRSVVSPTNSLRAAQAIPPEAPLGFGYMFWTMEDLGAYCAFGFAGQYICVWDDLDIVAALTCAVDFAPPVAARSFLETVSTANFNKRSKDWWKKLLGYFPHWGSFSHSD